MGHTVQTIKEDSDYRETREFDSGLTKLIDALAREAARRDYAKLPISPFLDQEAAK